MNEKNAMKADMVKKLAILLVADNENLTMEQALSIVFNSETYQKIIDECTCFYYQSSKYVYAFLKEEILKGKFE